jgi:cell division septal protein FtsQ
MSPGRPKFGRRFGGRRSPERDASARAVRARDHLARKREQERRRLERDRARHEIGTGRRRLLRIATPTGFVLAVALGVSVARPVSEWLWLGGRPLERVAVQGAKALAPGVIAATAGAFSGRPLAHVDPETLREALRRDPWIAAARVLRLPGGTLLIEIEERGAIARWQTTERTELVDPSGARFAGALEPGGPLPTVHGEASVPGALPEDALEILDAIAGHAAFARDPAAVRLHLPRAVGGAEDTGRGDARGYVLELGAEGPRALLGRRHFSQRVARLATLLDEEADAVREARWIDLRYADRAVLGAEPASG